MHAIAAVLSLPHMITVKLPLSNSINVSYVTRDSVVMAYSQRMLIKYGMQRGHTATGLQCSTVQ